METIQDTLGRMERLYCGAGPDETIVAFGALVIVVVVNITFQFIFHLIRANTASRSTSNTSAVEDEVFNISSLFESTAPARQSTSKSENTAHTKVSHVLFVVDTTMTL